jgi:hypothetical protein
MPVRAANRLLASGNLPGADSSLALGEIALLIISPRRSASGAHHGLHSTAGRPQRKMERAIHSFKRLIEPAGVTSGHFLRLAVKMMSRTTY